MRAFDNYCRNLDVLSHENREDHLSLDAEYVERVLNPRPPSEHARANARQGAISLEEDRQHG